MSGDFGGPEGKMVQKKDVSVVNNWWYGLGYKGQCGGHKARELTQRPL